MNRVDRLSQIASTACREQLSDKQQPWTTHHRRAVSLVSRVTGLSQALSRDTNRKQTNREQRVARHGELREVLKVFRY